MTFELPQSMAAEELLRFFSALATPCIAALAVLHLIFFGILRIWRKRELVVLAETLDEFTRGLEQRSELPRNTPLEVQIDAFLQDVGDIISDPSRIAARHHCLNRLDILDQRRTYLNSLKFETAFHTSRTMIEAYPLTGVLGTVLAIGSALQSDTASGATVGVNLVMERFGDSIWSTFTGLSAAVVLLFVSSLQEVRVRRLAECRIATRDLVARAKRELRMSACAGVPKS